MRDTLTFSAVRARQSPSHTVLSFPARASELKRFAAIDRIGRDTEGLLSGFQRPQIASHIREIRDYLEQPDSILPNPIVVAFTKGVEVRETNSPNCELEIDVSEGAPGLVVDGQQRLSALMQLEGRDFEVLVSAVICGDEAELRRQFVLVNNTRPLPKSLIYELLPGVDGLPSRLSNRSFASELTAKLNYAPGSFLRGEIYQHTNPGGRIKDTAIQRVIMSSLSDGMMRELLRRDDDGAGAQQCFDLISDYYRAVALVFPDAWAAKHTPKTSRLVHGAGIVALGYVMEVLALLDGARSPAEFAKGLGCLEGRTAWTSGEWDLGDGDRRNWRAIQNVNRDIVTLAQHLIGIVRTDIRARRSTEIAPDQVLLAAVGA
ncbi:MAG: DGQHR domain-containing protein DpdB [Amaricoccus sp.]|uniref:DGQHR domain-containing protein DpdB n=1 Tax=Amaricoccus sp. TaxID=1872485 RepID=UPI0033163DC0